MFLKYPKNRASCSYKLGSFKKKSVVKPHYNGTKGTNFILGYFSQKKAEKKNEFFGSYN